MACQRLPVLPAPRLAASHLPPDTCPNALTCIMACMRQVPLERLRADGTAASMAESMPDPGGLRALLEHEHWFTWRHAARQHH